MITVDGLRAFVLALPEVEERRTWGHPTFRVRGKMFLTVAEGGVSATVKASLDEQAGLVAEDPDTFSVAAYVGRHGWVQVRIDRIDDAHMRELVVDAWRTTAPKRLVTDFDERTCAQEL